MVLSNGQIELVIVPGLGASIISLRILETDLDLLWSTPWGLRPPYSVMLGSDAEARAMQAYPGGWQTMFPNAGDATTTNGVDWPMHGEAWTAPFDWEISGHALRMTSRFALSPFHFVKELSLSGLTVHLKESATNVGAECVDAMWGQHPAFGPPFVSDALRVHAGGRTIALLMDPSGPESLSDWTQWPAGQTIHGERRLLDVLPDSSTQESRMNYVVGHPGSVELVNEPLGVAVRMDWDRQTFPHFWYWLESGGRQGFPWYGAARVLAIEPASSWPGWGVTRVRDLNSTTITFAPGETKSAWLDLTISAGTQRRSPK